MDGLILTSYYTAKIDNIACLYKTYQYIHCIIVTVTFILKHILKRLADLDLRVFASSGRASACLALALVCLGPVLQFNPGSLGIVWGCVNQQTIKQDMKMKSLNRITTVFALALVSVFVAGCNGWSPKYGMRGGLKPSIHPLDIPTDPSGFVRGDAVKGRPVQVPDFGIVLNSELPGSDGTRESGAPLASRVFIGTPVRLETLTATLGVPVGPNAHPQAECSKFVIKLNNPCLVEGLITSLEANSVATLRYTGKSAPVTQWSFTSVDTGVRTLMLEITVCGSNGKGDWICSKTPSAGIRQIQKDQRILRGP
jgi:hypothetical protein